MSVTFKFYGELGKHIKDYNHKEGISLQIVNHQKIAGIIKKIGIPRHKISLILLNDKNIDFDYVAKDNDLIKVFPPLGGG